MKQVFYTLTISILLTSCATIVNQQHKYVTVHTTEPSSIILGQDTINTIDNKAHLRVQRKDELLSIVATTDSLTKSVSIEPKKSIMYWSNILFNCGIGMLVDMNNPKRYAYPDKIYINSADAKDSYSIYGQASNKGELYLHFSLPSINHFLMTTENEGTKAKMGIGGVTLGLDYYHSAKQFVHFGLSAFYGGISNRKNDSHLEYLSSAYISLSNNHKIGRFSIGYGLSFAENIYSKLTWFFWFIPEEWESHNALGLIFPSYFQLGEHFNIGLIYRPTFYRPNMTDKFAYEHLISIDFAWKVRVKK